MTDSEIREIAGCNIGDKVMLKESHSPGQVRWGGNDDPTGKIKLNTPYIVKDIHIHTWHTKLELEGIDGKFNSVSFKRVN